MTRRVALLLALLLGVGGCTAGGSPSLPPAAPGATGSDTTSTPAIPPTRAGRPTLAPRVPAPRDARGIEACALLTPAQQAALDIDPATELPEVQGVVRRCEWRSRDRRAFLGTSVLLDAGTNGLEGLYLLRSTFGVFEPGELDGFPIVHADRGDDRDTFCTIYVGNADDQMVWATAGYAADPRSACALARRIASDMIANLPPLR